MDNDCQDHVAIQQLMYRYAHCADNKDYEGFARVFCEDAVFDYSGREVTPYSAIQEMMHALDKYSATLHQVTNTLYEVDGDGAVGETYCLASHLLQEGDETVKLEMGITYRDRLRRTAGGWRIAHRAFILHWSRRDAVEAGP